MNTLARTLIEKAGYANGWENVKESNPERVVMFSARHRAEAHVSALSDGSWLVVFPKGPPSGEILQSFPGLQSVEGGFTVNGDGMLGNLLRRAAKLAMSLPNQVADIYAEKVAELEQTPPSLTEVLRLTKQRVGQDLFRGALMNYWSGACAVTGILVPELLRASHAKPWAACATDAERLNVFNGFLLCAHLDALFDSGLLTFTDEGDVLLSEHITPNVRVALNLTEGIRLRWCSPKHIPFLQWHRKNIAHFYSSPESGSQS
jgi:putative restriction endonuclease